MVGKASFDWRTAMAVQETCLYKEALATPGQVLIRYDLNDSKNMEFSSLVLARVYESEVRRELYLTSWYQSTIHLKDGVPLYAR